MQRALISALLSAGLVTAGTTPLTASAVTCVEPLGTPRGDDVTIDTRDVGQETIDRCRRMAREMAERFGVSPTLPQPENELP